MRTTRGRALALLMALLALAGCDPRELADKALARTAEAVVTPVLGAAAARCVVEAGSPEELRIIARDIGVEAGTSTVANIAAIASRPEAARCIAASAGAAG